LRKSSASTRVRPSLDEYCTIIVWIPSRQRQGAKLALKVDHGITGTELSGRNNPPDEDAMAANNLMLLQYAIDGAYRRIQQWRAGFSFTPRRIPESIRTTDAIKACEMPRQRFLSGFEQADAKVPIGENGIVCLRFSVDWSGFAIMPTAMAIRVAPGSSSFAVDRDRL